MKLQIRLTVILSLLITLGLGDFPTILNSQLKISSVAVAQTTADRKKEADRLFNQGIQQYKNSQFQAAIQSWQQAIIIYREIKDRQGEGNALGYLGSAYQSLGHNDKAIEYYQQWLAIAREIKNRLSEGNALGSLEVLTRISVNMTKPLITTSKVWRSHGKLKTAMLRVKL